MLHHLTFSHFSYSLDLVLSLERATWAPLFFPGLNFHPLMLSSYWILLKFQVIIQNSTFRAFSVPHRKEAIKCAWYYCVCMSGYIYESEGNCSECLLPLGNHLMSYFSEFQVFSEYVLRCSGIIATQGGHVSRRQTDRQTTAEVKRGGCNFRLPQMFKTSDFFFLSILRVR